MTILNRNAIIAAVCLLLTALTLPVTLAQSAGPYKISGVVVSKIDGHLLSRARVTIYDTRNPGKSGFAITSDDGKFEFSGLPAGKFALGGAKRGFTQAAYEEHEQFSTAIVTGPGLDSESLILRLAPEAIISGKILDESGDPVRGADVSLYIEDRSGGFSKVHSVRSDRTDDQGAYEFSALRPGNYFLSVNATPWYAVRPATYSNADGKLNDPSTTFDRSLDVAYPLTYYPDVTSADSATPIPIRGGDRIQVDIHLTPAPALRLVFRLPQNANGQFATPTLEQSTFDGSTSVPTEGAREISPGVMEVTGVPAGQYDIRLMGDGSATQVNGVNVGRDGEEIDVTHSESLSTVKVLARNASQFKHLSEILVGLRSARQLVASGQVFNDKGEAFFNNLSPGRYEVVVAHNNQAYSPSDMSIEGATLSGQTLVIPAGATASLSLNILDANIDIDGIAKRSGKPSSGAMVVLVPKDPENNRILFRRDQTDSDGTFSLKNVSPGSYTVIAIDDGWDLDWSQPGVIGAYLKHGQSVKVAASTTQSMKLPDPVEVQAK